MDEKERKEYVEAAKGYDWCEDHGGHVAASDIEGWLCLRCWVGWFMGMWFLVSEDERDAIMNGTTRKLSLLDGHIRVHTVWDPSERGTVSTIEHGGVVYFLSGEKLLSYEEALAIGPTVKPHKDGGPPYVYELGARVQTVGLKVPSLLGFGSKVKGFLSKRGFLV